MRYSILIFLFIGCHENSNIKNKNAKELINVKDSILFIDKDSNLFINQEMELMSRDFIEGKSKGYYDVVLFHDSVIKLKSIIDINTFKRLNESSYIDKFFKYVFNYSPNTFPSFEAKRFIENQ